MISVKCEWRPCLHNAFNDHPNHILDRNDSLLDLRISHTIEIFFLPFFSQRIFQCISFFLQDLMRTHQIPFSLKIVSRLFPEIIRIAYSRENIMRLHSVISVICPQVEKFWKIPMPHIKIDRCCSLTNPKLIDRDCRVIDQTYPADHTSCCSLKSTDRASACTHFSKVHSHSAAKFADFRKIINALINSIQTVRHCIDKAGGKLVVRLSRIGKCRCRHRHLQLA